MMEYYSALKTNDLSSLEKTWKELQCILLSERSQSEKAIYCVIPTICYSGKGETMEVVIKISGCKGLGGGREAIAENKRFYMWVNIFCMIS